MKRIWPTVYLKRICIDSFFAAHGSKFLNAFSVRPDPSFQILASSIQTVYEISCKDLESFVLLSMHLILPFSFKWPNKQQVCAFSVGPN